MNKTNKYKLIATDCDGTLINNCHELTERTLNAIKKCLDNGVIFVLATGRPTYGVQWFADLFDENLPLVTYNGAAVTMSKTKEPVLGQLIPPNLSIEAITLGRERNSGVVAYVDNRLYIAELNKFTIEYARFFNITPNVPEDINEIVKNGATKVLWTDTPENIGRYYYDMALHFMGRLNCHTSASSLLEFVGMDASKGLALKRIGELYGIKPDEMIAIGDGFNDLSMIEYAGLGVAMANAPEGVKEKADRITLTNDEDGAAAIIEEFVL